MGATDFAECDAVFQRIAAIFKERGTPDPERSASWRILGAYEFFSTPTSPAGPFDAIHGPDIVVYRRPQAKHSDRIDFRKGDGASLLELERSLIMGEAPRPQGEERKKIVAQVAAQLLGNADQMLEAGLGRKPGPQDLSILIEAFFKTIVDMVVQGVEMDHWPRAYETAAKIYAALVSDKLGMRKRVKEPPNPGAAGRIFRA